MLAKMRFAVQRIRYIHQLCRFHRVFLINVLLCWIFCIKLGFGLYGYYIASAVDEGMRGLMYRIRWNKRKPLQKFER